MSVRLPESQYPVVFVEAWWGDVVATGSGTVIGPNTILTASHVIYDRYLGGLPDEVYVAPGYNPENPNPTVLRGTRYWYYDSFDPDGDGYLLPGDRNSRTLGHAEVDIALIKTDGPIPGPQTQLGYAATGKRARKAINRQVGVAGHPGVHGLYMMGDTGEALVDPVDWAIRYRGLDINSGQSGGPVFNRSGVISPVSTSGFGADVAAHRNWINGERFIASNRAKDADNGEKSLVDIAPLRARVKPALDLHEFVELNHPDKFVDSITGLPSPSAHIPEHIKNPDMHRHSKLPVETGKLRAISLTPEQVAQLFPSEIFDTAGTHIFSADQIGNKKTKGSSLVVVSDSTPGFNLHADNIFYTNDPIYGDFA